MKMPRLNTSKRNIAEENTIYEGIKDGVEYENTISIDGEKIRVTIKNGKIWTGKPNISTLLTQQSITVYKNDNGYYYTGLNGQRMQDYEGKTPANFIKKFMKINNIQIQVKEKMGLFD